MILIALGANLAFEGQGPVQNMERVVALLADHPQISVRELSPIYASAPVGKTDQPDFFNAVLSADSSLEPMALMGLLLEIEKSFGRLRGERWGPRTMDLDLIDFEGKVLDLEEGEVSLHLPHPRLHERAFVLRPLQDLEPEWTHPASGEGLKVMLERIGEDQALSVYEG